jgi:hypothetical protein
MVLWIPAIKTFVIPIEVLTILEIYTLPAAQAADGA